MNNKKIIFQVTKIYMKKNRKRTLVTFLGILIMVILMTAVFVGKDTVLEYMKNAAIADRGDWHYQIYDIDKEQMEQIKSLDFVEDFETSKPLGYTDFKASGNPGETPYLEIKEYSENLFDWMNINVKEGRYPTNSSEVIISERALKEGANIKLGDTINAEFFDRYVHALNEEEQKAAKKEGQKPSKVYFPAGFRINPGETLKVPDHFPYYENNELIEMLHKPTGCSKNLTVVGFMEEPYYGAPGQGGYIALTGMDNTEKMDGNVNGVLRIDLDTHADCQVELESIIDKAEADNINSRIVSNDMLLIFAAKGQDGNVNNLMIFCQGFFVVLVTVASLILIYNVFSISYQERCKYLGMLSSVGATRRQKRWSVYYEVFVLLIFALPLGILTGLLIINGVMSMLHPYFSKILSAIAQNVISNRVCDISYKIVVNPLNILLVVFVCVVSVWISALIPARRISKVGPIESIKGNEVSKKHKKKGYKTHLGIMLKGNAERLMATASVKRNTSSTKGIMRSITACTTLILITAFAARSIVDVLDSSVNQEVLIPGAKYTGYSYMFEDSGHLDPEMYQLGRNDILNSKEVSDYKEMDVTYFMDCVPIKYYNEEYVETVKTVLQKWFPAGVPKNIQEALLGNDAEGSNPYTNPEANIITLKEKDFNKLANRAGIDLSKYEKAETGPILVYDSLRITTQDYLFFDEGAEKPNYSEYNIKNPLSVNEGEAINLEITEFDEDDKEYEVTVPVTFAGYISENDIKDYFKLNGMKLFIIVSEQTRDNILLKDSKFGYESREKSIFFNLNSDDSDLLRSLSQIEDEFGRSAVSRTGIFSEYTDFRGAVVKIIDIVAVCFIILIAVICLLNLYNSVLGRYLSRHKELSILHSLGMTKKQKNKMLLIENVGLLTRAFIKAAVITTIVVLCLHKMMDLLFGRVDFSTPVWAIIMAITVSIVGLFLFTKVCYGHDSKSKIIEEIRMESI